MHSPSFFHTLMRGYDRPELRLEIRRRNLEPEPSGPMAGRRLFKSAWYPLEEKALDYAYKTALSWQRNGDVFFGVLPRKGCTRSDADVSDTRAIWVEIDGQAQGQQGALDLLHKSTAEGIYAPHFVVGSGGGVHAYWMLSERATLTESLRSTVPVLLKRLCCAIGNLYWEPNSLTLSKANPHTAYADPMSTNVGRILRVPGTWNHKASRNCQVGLIEQNANAPTLSLAQWDDWLPAAPKCKPVQWRPKPGEVPGSHLPRHTKDMLDQAYPEGERYEALRTILCAARHAGWSQVGLYTLCDLFRLANAGCSQQVIDELVKATMFRIHPDA